MKQIILGGFLALLLLGAGGYALSKISPWPSVWLIRHAFATRNGTPQADAASLRSGAVQVRRGLVYDAQFDDARFDLFRPASQRSLLPAIVWIHGGGFIAGSRADVSEYLQVVASHGYVTVAIDYTRAPAAKFPTPVRQTNSALAHLAANARRFGIDPTRIFLSGDSAGANIAAQTALTISDPGYAQYIGAVPGLPPSSLRGVLLFCGLYNGANNRLGGSFGTFIRTGIWAYLGTRDATDPRMAQLSVAPFVTASYPPTFISVGNADPLAPQSVELAKALSNKGVEVDTLFFPADQRPPLGHEYHTMLQTPAGRLALARTIAFLTDHSQSGQ